MPASSLGATRDRLGRRPGAARLAWVLLAAALGAAGAGAQTGAGLFLSATRLVFPAASREASLQVYNQNPYPVVVQSWIDGGDLAAEPDAIDVPFVVLPPLMKLQPNGARALRVVQVPPSLPGDRESVFWLNAQMIPPQRREAGGEGAARNAIDVSVRIRQKVFFRPSGLVRGSDEWIEKLDCTPARDAEGVAVRCRNPTPYFATLDRLRMADEGGRFGAPGDMLEPFGDRVFRLEPEGAAAADGSAPEDLRGRLAVAVIDDQGQLRVVTRGRIAMPAPPR